MSAMKIAELLKRAEKQFNQIDRNSDGYVTMTELIKQVRAGNREVAGFLGIQEDQVTMKEASQGKHKLVRAFTSIDLDSDKKVSLCEYLTAVRKVALEKLRAKTGRSMLGFNDDGDNNGTEKNPLKLLSIGALPLASAAESEKIIESGALNKNETPRPKNVEQKLGSKANLVVICGPSAVGKGTILGILKKQYPGMFGVAISHTTRGPRSGEKDGTHYHFVDKQTFEAMRDNKEFLELADVHGKYYGTSKAAVNKVCEKGGVCILEIDVQGAQTIKESGVEAKFLFITTSGGIIELEKRLRGRGTESEDKILKRLKTSQRELQFLKEKPEFFDKVLLNDEINSATKELRSSFVLWFPQLKK
eukprot:jgi/Bigna1/52947/estExt_Genewise1Plus.C_130165